MLDAHKHALRVELSLLYHLAEVGLLLAQLEVGQAEGHLDDLVEVLEAADARVEEDRLRHARSTCDGGRAAHPKVILNGGDYNSRVDGEPAGDRRVNQQQDDRLEDLDNGILRAAVEVVDHHAQPQRSPAAELLVVVLLGAQQVVQVLNLRLDLAHEAEALRHVDAPRRLLRLLEEHVASGAAQVGPHAPGTSGTSAASPTGIKPTICSGHPDAQSQNSPTAPDVEFGLGCPLPNSLTTSDVAEHKNTRSSCSKAKYSPTAAMRPHAMESKASTRRWRTEHRRFCRLVSGESEGS
eukprot:scaffold23354_cov58-Phaeocystis_antarctica.AAC.1